MDCREVEVQEIAERYLMGRLEDEQRQDYELHYLGCGACFDALETLQMAQEDLRSRAPEIRARAVRAAQRRWMALAAGLAATVVLGVFLFRWRPEARVSVADPESRAVETADAALVELARITPPKYEPLTLRGNTNRAEQLFPEAMQSYLRGDYAGTIPGLRKALAANAEYVPARFFLAACELLTGDTDGALEDTHRAIAAGDTPLLEESEFLLAKVLLSKKDVAGARRALDRVRGMNGEWRREAELLTERLDSLPR